MYEKFYDFFDWKFFVMCLKDIPRKIVGYFDKKNSKKDIISQEL